MRRRLAPFATRMHAAIEHDAAARELERVTVRADLDVARQVREDKGRHERARLEDDGTRKIPHTVWSGEAVKRNEQREPERQRDRQDEAARPEEHKCRDEPGAEREHA